MSNAIKVKICGVQTVEAALVAAESGADFLGFNFVEGVRRQLQAAEGIALINDFRDAYGKRGELKVVGLFRNQDLAWVNDVVEQAGLDCVQLADDEDDSYVTSINRPVMRQVRVKPGMTQGELAASVQVELGAGRKVLLDRYDAKAPGGAGIRFDWSVAQGVANSEGVLLAGGLTPGNVGDAIRQLQPWGVDVASGVETDGVKDHDKIRAFIAAARAA